MKDTNIQKLNIAKLTLILLCLSAAFSVAARAQSPVSPQTPTAAGCVSGNCVNGKGKMVYANGNIYEGNFVNGKEEGQGTYTFKTGEIYTGQFANDKYNGRGKLKDEYSGTYEGDFVDGKFEGQGTYTFKNGDVYTGQFSNNVRNGKGKIKHVGGNIYDGNWVDNKKTGKGKLTFPDGTIYDGNWVDNNYHGIGTIKYASGDIYEGNFVYGIKEGQGTYTLKNGDSYTGEWKYNRRNGYGKEYIKAANTTRQGTWKDDVFTGKDSPATAELFNDFPDKVPATQVKTETNASTVQPQPLPSPKKNTRVTQNPNPKNEGQELLDAIKANDTASALKLINKGVNLYYFSEDESSLSLAALKNNLTVVRAMFEAKADPNYVFDDYDNSAFTKAIGYMSKEMLELFLQYGADVTFKSKRNDNWTPLHHAAQKNTDENVIKLLLAAGADPNAINSTNSTPLSLAVLFKNNSVIPILTAASNSPSTNSNNCVSGNCVNGYGKMVYDSGDTYEGGWVNGKFEGQGTFINKDGGYYIGELKNDMPNGYGKQYNKSANTLREGNWKDGILVNSTTAAASPSTGSTKCVSGNCDNGYGKFVFPDGGVYEGNIVNGQGNGQGKYVYANGDIYEGDFVKGNREGQGTYTFKSGAVYTGEWRNGKYNGRGKIKYPNGDIYEGDFVDNKKNGKGKSTFPSGDIYEGNYVNGNYEGQGTYTFKNGNYYSGEWKNGKQNGYGKFYNKATNTTQEGTWKDGVFVGKQ